MKYKAYFVDIAVSYVRDRTVAEDMVADTFLKLLEGQEKTNPVNLPAYLYVSLKHRCLDWVRNECIHLKAQENIQKNSLAVMEERLSRLESDEPQSLLLLDAVEIVKRELRKMPEQRRKVFLALLPMNESFSSGVMSPGEIRRSLRHISNN